MVITIVLDELEVLHTETVAENVNRILKGQINNIIGHCTGEQEDKHKSVHEIRKSIKRIRAVLRLIRDEIGYSTYYRENIFYRDLGRRLSEVRNFNVLIDSTGLLRTDLSNTIPGSEFDPLIASLEEQRNKLLDRLVIQEEIMKAIPKKLDTAKSRIRDFPVLHDDFSAFAGGLIRIYRQGKRYKDISRQHPTSRNLHDLRKRIKYLWYQMLILYPIFPSMLQAYAEILNQIGENLGNHHDFDVLHRFLDQNPGLLEERIHTTLMEACEIKKTSILSHTWNAIDSIYSEKPMDIAGRFTHYWSIYRNETQNNIISST